MGDSWEQGGDGPGGSYDGGCSDTHHTFTGDNRPGCTTGRQIDRLIDRQLDRQIEDSKLRETVWKTQSKIVKDALEIKTLCLSQILEDFLANKKFANEKTFFNTKIF